jgi:hypothetical protein
MRIGLLRGEISPPHGSERDFVTLEDVLPAAASLSDQVSREAATLFTEVKHETTDDN